MCKTEFRRVRDEELDEAYAIIVEATEWLNARGIRQWTVPLPRDAYATAHARGENYALTCDGEIAVVVSLVRHASRHWTHEIGGSERLWLRTLATARKHAGGQLGRRAVEASKIHLRQTGIGEVYLDCVRGGGFLPRYYESLGFCTIARKDVVYPTGVFDMVLMRCDLAEEAGA
jgi:N-acetylglutamate synthase-like GNAT family acetyltransferase